MTVTSFEVVELVGYKSPKLDLAEGATKYENLDLMLAWTTTYESSVYENPNDQCGCPKTSEEEGVEYYITPTSD